MRCSTSARVLGSAQCKSSSTSKPPRAVGQHRERSHERLAAAGLGPVSGGPAKARDDAGQGREPRLERCPGGRQLADERAQRLGERTERDVRATGHGTAAQHDHVSGRGVGHELACKTRLADAGFADDDGHRPATVPGLDERAPQHFELASPSDDDRAEQIRHGHESATWATYISTDWPRPASRTTAAAGKRHRCRPALGSTQIDGCALASVHVTPAHNDEQAARADVHVNSA